MIMIVQPYYLALWRKYEHLIDYINFQFYAYDKGTIISQFFDHFETQTSNYNGGKVLVSFGTDGSGGLSPKNGFFRLVVSIDMRKNFMVCLYGQQMTPKRQDFLMRSSHKPSWPAQSGHLCFFSHVVVLETSDIINRKDEIGILLIYP